MTPEPVASQVDQRSSDADSSDTSPLEGFWASDTWVMRASPLGLGQGTYRFGGLTRQLTEELKLAVRAKLLAREWSIRAQQPRLVNRLVAWLALRHPTPTTLLDRPLESWTLDLRGYLLEHGLLRQPIRRQVSRDQAELRSALRDHTIVVLRSLYAKLLALVRPSPLVPEFEKDVWDARRMGAISSPARSDYSLSFIEIAQPWLRAAAKHFIRHTIITTSYRSAKGQLTALNHFSAYTSHRCSPVALRKPWIEVLYGELYAKRVDSPAAIANPTSSRG